MAIHSHTLYNSDCRYRTIYIAGKPIGGTFFHYNNGRNIHSGSYKLKFGSDRSPIVYILMVFFPLVYVVLRIGTFEPARLPSRKKRLDMANTLLQCIECNKYNRGYQTALISEYEGTCVHCNGEVNIKDTRTDDKAKLELIRFLETHPECPKISYKELKLMIDYWEAKQYNKGVGKVNKEIERVMKSYEETGNQYIGGIRNEYNNFSISRGYRSVNGSCSGSICS